MLVLGIDPGIANTGWGIVDFSGQRFQPVCYGVINTDTDDRLDHRIAVIAESVSQIAQKYDVKQISMEDIFFAKNTNQQWRHQLPIYHRAILRHDIYP